MATQIIQKKPIVIGSPTPLTQEQLHPSVVVLPSVLPTTPLVLTKYQFRKLFTLAERTAIDNIQYNSAFAGSIKATVTTLQKDLEVSGEVDIHLTDTIAGVRFLESVGLVGPGRANRILSNLPPL
jgi:hypothetical protein